MSLFNVSDWIVPPFFVSVEQLCGTNHPKKFTTGDVEDKLAQMLLL